MNFTAWYNSNMKNDSAPSSIKTEDSTRPTKKEQKALRVFLNKFYKLYDEITSNSFMNNSPDLRFYKIKDLFAIYRELLDYELINSYLKCMKNGGRPIFDGIISDDLFICIRNIFAHYPLFDSWDDVYIDKDLATWNKDGKINKFLSNCDKVKIDGKPIVKYRIWQYETKKMTYFAINLNNSYKQGEKVFLHKIVSEDVGAKFFAEMMKRVVDVAIENPPKPKIDIMSQVYIPSAIDKASQP